MSNLERDGGEITVAQNVVESGPKFSLLAPREVPLGGPRALLVRRTLPHKDRRMIGAWCFIDHYGPVDLTDSTRSETPGMRVPPHPHTGLQTVSWLIDGAIEHRDSVGSKVIVHPGQLNLMTAGAGIAHSEDSLAEPTLLHGIQLWVALPEASRSQSPHFEHHGQLPRIDLDGAQVLVFIGELLGASSPAATYTPIVGAEIRINADREITIPLREDFEYGVLAVQGDVEVTGEHVPEHNLVDLGSGRSDLVMRSREGALLLLLGGEPFNEEIIMWWNFIGRTHDEIEQMRTAWQEHRLAGEVPYPTDRLDAPPMPLTRLKARGSQR